MDLDDFTGTLTPEEELDCAARHQLSETSLAAYRETEWYRKGEGRRLGLYMLKKYGPGTQLDIVNRVAAAEPHILFGGKKTAGEQAITSQNVWSVFADLKDQGLAIVTDKTRNKETGHIAGIYRLNPNPPRVPPPKKISLRRMLMNVEALEAQLLAEGNEAMWRRLREVRNPEMLESYAQKSEPETLS